MRAFLLPIAALAAASTATAQSSASPHAAHSHSALHGASAARPTIGRYATTFAPVLTVTARDYAFDAADTIPAGLTTVRLLNRGTELHHVWLVRLDAGKTADDFLAALKAGGPPPSWVHDMGGPNTPRPGGDAQATLELAPGNYVITCVIPSPDGVPHVAKGMVKPLVVKRSTARPAKSATPDATMRLLDYNFELSKALKPGTRTIRVRNDAQQPHEVLIVRLAPGKTVNDVLAWIEKPQGPPPGEPIGGTTGIATGGWNDVTLTLTPGEYGLLCFVPDAKDGKPHFVHGMLKQFVVGK
jgi:plastocyanin